MPPSPMQPEQAIPIMKHALEAGANFWVGADYYGTRDYNSLHLLRAYFSQYPEDVERVVLSIKVGFDSRTFKPKADPASIRESFKYCQEVLAGTKGIDILSCARVDPEVQIEESIGALYQLVQEGHIRGVGISECSAATLRKAAKVCKIEAAEVEFSMFTTDILNNGVAEAARESGTVVVAYSPIGRGMLTGSVMNLDDLSATDPRRRMPRFAEDAINHNAKLVTEIAAIAKRLNVTSTQVALAWIRSYSGQSERAEMLPIPGSKNMERIDENMKEVLLSMAEREELDAIVVRNPIIGDRYPASVAAYNWG